MEEGEEERESGGTDGDDERGSDRRGITAESAVLPVAMETDDLVTLPAEFKVPNFDWLTSHHFGEGSTLQST